MAPLRAACAIAANGGCSPFAAQIVAHDGPGLKPVKDRDDSRYRQAVSGIRWSLCGGHREIATSDRGQMLSIGRGEP